MNNELEKALAKYKKAKAAEEVLRNRYNEAAVLVQQENLTVAQLDAKLLAARDLLTLSMDQGDDIGARVEAYAKADKDLKDYCKQIKPGIVHMSEFECSFARKDLKKAEIATEVARREFLVLAKGQS